MVILSESVALFDQELSKLYSAFNPDVFIPPNRYILRVSVSSYLVFAGTFVSVVFSSVTVSLLAPHTEMKSPDVKLPVLLLYI